MNAGFGTTIRTEVSRRNRKVQKTLVLLDPDSAAESKVNPVRETGPPPCRAALAHWPDDWRERWGRRANALEEAGLPWQEAESRAFLDVWKERQAVNRN